MIRKSANKIFNINHKNSIQLLLLLLFSIIIICLPPIEAKRVRLVPLTAHKVYQLLGQSNNLDAVPEGRVVAQGIAAVNGFTLGLKTALAGTLLYDIITANITEDDTVQPASVPVYLTQEVCFSSRTARSLDEAEAIAEAYSRLEERDTELQATVRESQTKRRHKPKRNDKRKLVNKQKNKIRRPPPPPRLIKVLKSNPDAATDMPTSTVTAVTQPSVTGAIIEDINRATTAGTQTSQPAATATADEKFIDAGTALVTTISTTTSTDNKKSLTCIVIQKPKK